VVYLYIDDLFCTRAHCFVYFAFVWLIMDTHSLMLEILLRALGVQDDVLRVGGSVGFTNNCDFVEILALLSGSIMKLMYARDLL